MEGRLCQERASLSSWCPRKVLVAPGKEGPGTSATATHQSGGHERSVEARDATTRLLPVQIVSSGAGSRRQNPGRSTGPVVHHLRRVRALDCYSTITKLRRRPGCHPWTSVCDRRKESPTLTRPVKVQHVNDSR